jgi:iron complex outermembrane receptor protein
MYLAASYRWKKWGISANYRYIHDLHNNTDDIESAVSYGLLDAKLSYRPLKWLDVFVKGENLTDKSYQTRFDFPMPGITVFGGINVSLK